MVLILAIIIILQEHWLWLFELSILANIQPNFTYCTVSNWLLNPDSDLQHRCEGVAILWKKCIICSTIPVNDCDRISGIRIPLNDQQSLSILGAYVPSVNRECGTKDAQMHCHPEVRTWRRIHDSNGWSLEVRIKVKGQPTADNG